MISEVARERFWSKVEAVSADECWLWSGARSTRGYGTMGMDGRTVLAHRISYEIHHGPIPTGLVIDHVCRNTACANPKHLEAVTQGENIRRGYAHQARERKTHCKRGHEFSEENTILDKVGARQCRTCRMARWRKARGWPEGDLSLPVTPFGARKPGMPARLTERSAA